MKKEAETYTEDEKQKCLQWKMIGPKTTEQTSSCQKAVFSWEIYGHNKSYREQISWWLMQYKKIETTKALLIKRRRTYVFSGVQILEPIV